ncbi:cell division cycle 48C [Artemisia annua]|uniref:Cell division cycle 48C n=1 Tax=Artemisia annua TaxID=35608 RepID=A0A2U1KX49_ARTAN|nr:cell division cycle 48C [Artemisia annua]
MASLRFRSGPGKPSGRQTLSSCHRKYLASMRGRWSLRVISEASSFGCGLVDALTTKCGKEGVWAIERLLNQARGDGPLAVWFGKLLYAPLPNEDERGMILKALALKKSLDADVDLVDIGRSDRCTNYQMNEAAMAAVEDKYSICEVLTPMTRCRKCSSTKYRVEHLLPNLSIRHAIEPFLESQVPKSAPETDVHKYVPACKITRVNNSNKRLEVIRFVGNLEWARLRMDKLFTKIRVLNRNVHMVPEGIDNFSNMIGSVYYADGELDKDLDMELL